MNLHPILILSGPTAVGKTALSIQLAKKYDAEIIMADSQALIKRLDIGTSKPSVDELRAVRHHLVNVIDFGEKFDAKSYAEAALKIISQLQKEGKKILIVGGSGLYIDAIKNPFFEGPSRNDFIRAQIKDEIENLGLISVYKKLKLLDPERAAQIHPNDEVRMIRALEVILSSGQKMSELIKKSQSEFQAAHHFVQFVLKEEREILYQRINDRVLQMWAEGWVEEVKSLMQDSYDFIDGYCPVIGYREIALYLQEKISQQECIEEIQKKTRHLAKKQMTWFKKDKNSICLSADEIKEELSKIWEE